MRPANENCPHTTRPDAGACSQCVGARVRRITQDGDWLLVDGVRTRQIFGESQAAYGRLGTGKRRAAQP